MTVVCGIRIHTDGDAPYAFDSAWDALAMERAGPRWFLTAGWYRAWLESVAAAEAALPIVVRWQPHGCLRAGLALQLVRASDRRQLLKPLSAPWADYHDAVGNPADIDAASALAFACANLSEQYNAAFCFDDVLPRGLLHAVAECLGLPAAISSPTAAIRLAGASRCRLEMERNEYRRKRSRINRLGSVACLHHATPAAVAARFSIFVESHLRQWHGRPDAVAPFEEFVVVEAFEAMIRHMAPAGTLLFTEMTLGGCPIAMYFGFRHGKHWGGYRTTYDLEHFRISPGHLMLHQMIDDFRAAGFVELDLMRGAYGYKTAYADILRHNFRFVSRESQ